MIQIIEINNISLGTPDTYGYFSLGDIEIEESEPASSLDLLDSAFECSCVCDGLRFKLVAIRNGLFRRYTVLSDFQKLPDYAVIENEEVLRVAKESIKDYISKENKSVFTLSLFDSMFSSTVTNYYGYDINSALSTTISQTN